MSEEQPDLELAYVLVRREGDELVYSAQAMPWLSIHDDDAISRALHDGADAMHLLATAFGPPLEAKPEGADLLTLVPARKEGDDDDRADGAA